jgi:hypothetical protein
MLDKILIIKIVLILLSLTVIGTVVGIMVNQKSSDNKLQTIERVANNRYYSYAKTVLEGGVIPSLSCVDCYGGAPLNGQAFTTVGNPNMDNGSPLYQIDYGPWKGQTFVDWDSSSGVMCGNSWGQPSKQAEIIYNILSLAAPNPIIQNKEVQQKYVKELYYIGTNTPTWNDWQKWHVFQPPQCYKSSQYFMDGGVYLGGFMGLPYNFNNNINWGHYGQTYGYTSLSQFFTGTVTQNFSGLLKGLDVAFVMAQNIDSQDQTALSMAFNSLLKQLTDSSNYNINTEADLKNAISWAIIFAYCKESNCAEYGRKVPYTDLNGLMMTMGYYFIDHSNKTHQGSVTMSVINNKIVEPKKEYPFKNEFLGASGGREPAYYFGSGTKPITAALVTNAICNAWFKNNKQGTADKFLKWYRGTGLDTDYIYKTYQAANMKDILNLPNQSYYSETVEKYTNFEDFKNIGHPKFTLTTNTIQNWYNIIFSNDNKLSCSWRGLSQDGKRCPTNQCYELLDSQGNPDPNPFSSNCNCETMKNLWDIFSQNLAPIDMINMNSGIADADTVLTDSKGLLPPIQSSLQLDYIDQIIGRTQSIGSINFIRELIGFNWDPGWMKRNNKLYPNTYGKDGYRLPAEYSSSGYTTLGSILWLLDPNGPKSKNDAKNWTEIKINESFLSSPLQKNNNYAGTSGNGGEKYFVEKNSLPQHNVLPKCNISNSKRMDRDCIGPSGADKTTCLMEDCCYQPSFVINNGDYVPWCFKKNE